MAGLANCDSSNGAFLISPFNLKHHPKLLQVTLGLLPLRSKLLHEFPKTGAMIQVDEMGEFMHHDVVYYMTWHGDQLPVKIEIPLRGTASPAGALFFDSDMTKGQPHLRGIVEHALMEVVLRFAVVPVQDQWAQVAAIFQWGDNAERVALCGNAAAQGGGLREMDGECLIKVGDGSAEGVVYGL